MWLFRRRGHRFRKSSLSNSVPLDGSETVPGLRQLDRSRRSQDLHSFLETNLSGLQGLGREGYQRYKGPYLDTLEWKDWKQASVDWSLALCGGSRKQWQLAYNVPEHAAMLQERIEENTVRYRGNYVWMAALAALLVTISRPWAMLGLVCMGALVYLNDRFPAPGGNPSMAALSATNGQAASAQQDPMRIAATAALYIVIFYSRCFVMLPRCALAAAGAVLLHAALRRARSEYGALNWQNIDAQAAKQQIDLCQLEADRLRQSLRPGVLFSELLSSSGLHASSRAGGGARGGQTAAEDPRRVFRELWGYSRQLGSFAVGCGARVVRLYWHEARERVRMWRIPTYVS